MSDRTIGLGGTGSKCEVVPSFDIDHPQIGTKQLLHKGVNAQDLPLLRAGRDLALLRADGASLRHSCRNEAIMHKIGVLLTIVFLILGFWDLPAVYQNETFQNVILPLLGIVVVCGGLKFALARS